MSGLSAMFSHASKPPEQSTLWKQISDIGAYLDETIDASPESCPIISRESILHIREMFNEMRALLPAVAGKPAAASQSKLTLDQQSTSIEQPLSRIRTRILEAESRSARNHTQSAQASAGLFADVAANVVGANELLENILQFADHGTLVKCRQVSKQFHSLIDTSPTLQRRLFLKPDFSYIPHSAPRILRRFPNGFSNATAREEIDDNEDIVGRSLSISVYFDLPFLRFEYQYGSIWPKMLICQPPIKRLKLPHDMCRRTRRSYITCDTGITLGHLYQAINDRLHHHRQYCGPICRMGMKKIARNLTMSFGARNSKVYGQRQVDFCTAPNPTSFPNNSEDDPETMV